MHIFSTLSTNEKWGYQGFLAQKYFILLAIFPCCYDQNLFGNNELDALREGKNSFKVWEEFNSK